MGTDLVDLEQMPGFDPAVPNGTRSVTEGRVFLGRNPDQGGLETVSCRDHGAMLCVAVNPAGKIWRCPACNEGAFAPEGG
jgi:hypothetical protein